MTSVGFMRQWARFRKQARLDEPLLVLNCKPSNLHQLSFVLEITTSLILQYSLPLHALPFTFNHQHNPDNALRDKLTPNYILQLLRLYQDMSVGGESGEEETRAVLAEVLGQVVGLQKTDTNTRVEYLKLLGVCVGMWGGGSKMEEGLRVVKGWWGCKNWLGKYLTQSTIEILILWGYFQSKNDMELLQDSNKLTQNIFQKWLKHIQACLLSSTQITDQIVAAVENQSKQISRICNFKGNKSGKELLTRAKQTILKRFSKIILPTIFAALFAGLQAIASETDVQLFSFTDIITYEQLFYFTLLDLCEKDRLHLFIAFHSFMRQHSVMPVLQINKSLSLQMNKAYKKPLQSLETMIENRNIKILQEFKVRPISLAHLVLDYYLKASGIFVKQNKKKVRPGLKPANLTISDPLHFLLIKKYFWEQTFGYELIGLSLWILLQAYCKQLCQKINDLPEKQTAVQYLKKLKITICVYLLGLKYPTKLLMYLPEENDITIDFITVPILPSLLLASNYFFKEFQRDRLQIRPRTDFSNEADVLPWGNKILSQTNIPFILHNHKGYRLFTQALPFIGSASLKPYAETIVATIATALQGLGVTSSASGPDRRQLLGQLPASTRDQMRILLLQVRGLVGDRTGSSVSQLLGLLGGCD